MVDWILILHELYEVAVKTAITIGIGIVVIVIAGWIVCEINTWDRKG